MQAAQERPGTEFLGERCEPGNDAAFGLWYQEIEPMLGHRLRRPRPDLGAQSRAPRLDARPQRPLRLENVG
jgi:hypothetical protein